MVWRRIFSRGPERGSTTLLHHLYEKRLPSGPVNDQVINHTAIIIEQKRVLPLTDVQLGRVIGQHGIEPIPRAVSRDDELSHVRNIEHSDRVSYALVLIHDAAILHRHEPAP